jgi:hypothetical protein
VSDVDKILKGTPKVLDAESLGVVLEKLARYSNPVFVEDVELDATLLYLVSSPKKFQLFLDDKNMTERECALRGDWLMKQSISYQKKVAKKCNQMAWSEKAIQKKAGGK